MTTVELTKEFIEEITILIDRKAEVELMPILDRLYPQDIAEIFDDLELDQAVYLTSLVEDSKRVAIVSELEKDVRNRFWEGYSANEIANHFVVHMDSDDAADVISDMDPELASDVMAKIEDRSYALSLTSLIRYPETSAGGLMGRELIKVNKNWTVDQCTDEIRNQAEEVERVFTVYTVDDNGVLVGWISLKKILLANGKTIVGDIYDENIIYLNTYAPGEEIAMIMKKYDLIALPIVDSFKRLVGRVTIDDVVDFITEEAVRDYQLAAGISESVESSDRVWLLSRARLPWLIIGLVGGVANSLVIGGFETAIQTNVKLAFFMPLVMAMGGNAGVQSSSIVVQGLANQTLVDTSLGRRLSKEFMVSLLNGLICSTILLGYSFIVGNSQDITITVSLSLLLIIIFASLMGAMIPLILNRFKIDPALATGPFITTSNDLIGLLLYFYIGNELMTQLL